MGYYADLEEQRTLCFCGHKKGNHRYIRLVGGNTGECLNRDCDCTIYKEKQ